jgi:hypothetical protein
MITKRKQKPKGGSSPLSHGNGNEWLSILKSLESLLADHTPQESALTITPAALPPIDKAALAAVDVAYTVTLRYYIALLEHAQPDLRAQKHISRLWQKAGTALRRYDASVAQGLRAGRPFWSAASTWSRDTIRKAWPTLNIIRVHANRTDPEVVASLRWGRSLTASPNTSSG